MKNTSHKAGFTLIELLIVIAIIVVISGLLFPVFAQARERARSAACSSNLKQISLAILQYTQDYDERVPPTFYCGQGSEIPGNYDCSNIIALRSWISSIQPYCKTYKGLFRCPDAEIDPYGIWNTLPGGPFRGWLTLSSYGYNYAYLTPESGPLNGGSCPIDVGYADGVSIIPVSAADIEEPASTVLVTDAKNVGNDSIGYFENTGVDPPATIDACYINGWGNGSDGDDPTQGGINTSTGDVDPRHSGGINVSFCDGHVRWLLPAALAAGTNWFVGINNYDVTVTDLSKDLWSLKKTGPSDL